MLIQHNHTDNKGVFFVETDDNILAEMAYTTTSNNKMIIEHTEVDEVLQGQNIGYELVHAAVEYARQHGMMILPVCNFAHSIFDKKPDFQDVLEKTTF
jgi:predicted GNAT family acetyltransferase